MIPAERRDSPRSHAGIMRGACVPHREPTGCVAPDVVNVQADYTRPPPSPAGSAGARCSLLRRDLRKSRRWRQGAVRRFITRAIAPPPSQESHGDDDGESSATRFRDLQ